MPMNEYKIVNATQLDADLASIANSIKEKTLETDKEYIFPEDFVSAIYKMSYNEDIKTIDDLTIEGKDILVNKGFYPEDVKTSIDDGLIIIDDLIIEENPTVALSEDGLSIEANYSFENSLDISITPGYVDIIEEAGSIKATGKTSILLTDLLDSKSEMDITVNENGSILIPAGYYTQDIIFTIPNEE